MITADHRAEIEQAFAKLEDVSMILLAIVGRLEDSGAPRGLIRTVESARFKAASAAIQLARQLDKTP